MIQTIFFDLDGTLLPMDQEAFIRAYLQSLTQFLIPHGYEPEALGKMVWEGTAAMVKNQGGVTNEAVFWDCFSRNLSRSRQTEEPLFQRFYETEFQNLKTVCGYNPMAARTVRELKRMGYGLVLATNPVFPALATRSRVRWTGLEPEDFRWITTYENSSRCKPNPDYYREILDTLNLRAGECLMVGNDVQEDMVAAQVGMQVFLLTDCLIHRGGEDLSAYPQGSFPELLAWIRSGCV